MGNRSPAPRLERRMEPQAPPGIFLCASAVAKSDFRTCSRGCVGRADRGLKPPPLVGAGFGCRSRLMQAGASGQTVERVRPICRPRFGPLPAGSRPAGRRTAESLKKCCVLQETRPERYGSKTGSDRRSNAAMGRINWAIAPASDRGLFPSNERPAAGRRE